MSDPAKLALVWFFAGWVCGGCVIALAWIKSTMR
jgi:hypothetical protein